VVIATHNENLIERFGHPTIRLAGGDSRNAAIAYPPASATRDLRA